MVMLHVKLKRHTTTCKQTFCPYTDAQPLGGSKGKNIFFKYGHVAYQTKGNEMYHNMQADILPLHTPLTPVVGLNSQNIFFLLKVAILHIKVGHAYTKCGLGKCGRFSLIQ